MKMLVLYLAMCLGAVCSIHGQVTRIGLAKNKMFDGATNDTRDRSISAINIGTSNATAENKIMDDFVDDTVDHYEYEYADSTEFEEWENYTFTIYDMNSSISYNFRENDSIPTFLTNGENDDANMNDNSSYIELGMFNLRNPGQAVGFCRIRNMCEPEYASIDANYCCIPCKCYNTCFYYGSCCLTISRDEFLMNTYSEECQVPSIGDRSMYVGSLSKRLINSCDVNAEIETIIKCNQRENDITDLKQLIPVNSHMTTKTYKNIYCAECNNEKMGFIGWQLTPISLWETHLICKNGNLLIEVLEKVFYRSGNITDKLNTMKGCYMHWHTDREIGMCIKKSNVIHSCFDPNFDNKQVINFCLKKRFYHPVKGIYGIYYNLFCLICNEGFDVINGTCKSPFYDIHETKNSPTVALRLPQNVVDVLDALDNGLPPPSSSFNDDEIQNMCPLTSITVESTCAVVMNELKGIGLDFLVKITFSEQIALNVSDIIISSNVRSLIPEDKNDTILCVMRVLNRYEDGSKTIAIVQQTLKNLDFVDLRKEYENFKERVESLNKEARNFASPFLVELFNHPLELIYDSPVSFAIYSAAFVSNECGRSVAMTDLQFCETYMFKRVLLIREDMIEVNGISFTAGEFLVKPGADLSVLICRDLYIIRKRQAKKLAVSSSTTSNESKLAAFVTGILIGCVCVMFNTKP